MINSIFARLDKQIFPISGELLLIRFGSSCVSSRIGSAQTREVEGWEEVLEFIGSGRSVPHQVLSKLFPQAVIKLEAFIRNPLSEEPWPFEAVLQFCRAHKGKVVSCDSVEGVVVSVDGLIVKIKRDGRIHTIFNPCNFPIHRGDLVCTHKGVLYHVLEAPPS